MALHLSESQLIEGPEGSIETIVDDPGVVGALYAVICHPHPLYGGTMDNKVVTTVARAFKSLNLPTLRFNFRGVGSSAGTYDGGEGETADALRIVEWGAKRWPGRGVVLAGFSFGAFVSLRLSEIYPLARLISIAPPIGRFNFSGLKTPSCPWWVIQGDADDVVEPQGVIDWTGLQVPKPTLIVMSGAGHYFHGQLAELRQVLIDTFRSD